MKISTRWLAATATCALLLGGASPALAQDSSKIDSLLLRLKDKGILTEDEYATLMARSAVDAQAPVAAAANGNSAAVTTSETQPPQQAAAQALDGRMVRFTESGVGLEMGGVTLKVSGSVNGFYTHDNPDRGGAGRTVDGGLAGVGSSSSSIRNGLLPGFLKVDVTTQQGGWDVGAHFGLYPGINSVSGVGGANSAGTPQALATSGIDARQTYLTFGRAGFGEIKVGRDIGLFGSDAILNDITLLSVGSTGGNAAPSNTSLGRIGIGYIYTDFMPQITYTTPKFGGLQASIGMFQPLVTIGNTEVNKSPGFQAKLTYDFKAEDFVGHAWVGGITQKHDGTGLFPSYTGSGFDLGAKLTYAGFGVTGYYYAGSGIGTTGLFILSTSAAGRKRDSDGFYAQATYTLDKFTVGGSYGESHLDLARGEINPTLLDTNMSYVGQLRYGLTSWVTLIGEYTHTRSEAQNGNRAVSDALTSGAILFF
ncbi:MAG TPA: porin [Sphingomonas sp.]|jgi:predicted porin|uniref:porin n=1 Tax=Sphingomonas sp. TaxID=28214 RepID=UPI002EDB8362